ncbi:putative Ig domain-containing protein [Candidatus Entotheonella palauensis]|uniref:putative Ig domain-containing protein n=1 Tax=Candidatus Entotheonella palauensis TaxID=93172 RepID=UPI0015C4CCF7|nr:putative Ig domain-containing protein [Candidatus Entotheonella palauensis]
MRLPCQYSVTASLGVWLSVVLMVWIGLATVRVHANSHETGQWSGVINWPHIPVSMAHLPNGNVITWASNERTSFPVEDAFTHSAIFNPFNNSFQTTNNPRHDMFCAGISLLEDGTIVAAGGNPQLTHTSMFHPGSLSWVEAPFLNQQRWYSTNVAMPDNTVFATFAKGANFTPELLQPGSGWTNLPGASMADLFNEQNATNGNAINNSTTAQWYAYMHVAPDGRVFHPGPTETMHWFDTSGSGDVQSAGKRLGGDRHRQFGISIMYDVGKLLVTGGNDISKNPPSTATAMTIDINGASPVVTPVSSMQFARVNHNAVMLPTGEVLVIGGNTSGILFSDQGSVFTPEVWNPQTQQWRSLANMSIPRNYHSVALLLQDGRVLSGGGGLCGNCATNHQDAQIFSPPYLFDADGSLASRPEIVTAPAGTVAGELITVQATGNIDRFSLIRLSSTTHSINSDQRFIPVDSQSLGANLYELAMHENPNVLIAGYYWLFAVDNQGTPSVGQLIQVINNADNRGWIPCADENQFCDFDGEKDVRYGANGAYAFGTFTDGVNCTNGVFGDPIQGVGKQCWYRNPGLGLTYEYFEGNWDNLPDFDALTPVHIGIVDDFNLSPREQEDFYGFRFRGMVDIETGGTYTFYTNSDDGSQLLINGTLVVDNDGLHPPVEQSDTINLSAGLHDIEVTFFEKQGGATLVVSYAGPGVVKQVIPAAVLFQPSFNFNTPPSVTSPGTQNSIEGEAVSLPINASDADGDALTYSASGLPANLSINPSSGIINGTLAAGSAGSYTVMVSVSDNIDTTDITFNWSVSSNGGGGVLCLGLVPTIVGTEGDDVISGTSGNDIIAGLGGNDIIRGRSGNDHICGGPGTDELLGDRGTDLLDGGAGDDLLRGGSGDDSLDGGSGNDNCRGDSGTDTATNCETLGSIENGGVNGPPTLDNPGNQANAEGDTVSLALSASDPDGDPLTFSASGLPANLVINPETGVITGALTPGSAGTYNATTTVSDCTQSATTSFTWTVTSGSSVLCFGLSATLVGTEGDDTLVGTTGDDVIIGLGGNDLIRGRGGNDMLCGNEGNDEILGQNGDDLIGGGPGNDLLKGGKGQDGLEGDAGNDDLRGNDDNDDLIGGAGDDTCNGNAGDDTVDTCETIRNIP